MFYTLVGFNLEILLRHRHGRFGSNNTVTFTTFLSSVQNPQRLLLQSKIDSLILSADQSSLGFIFRK